MIPCNYRRAGEMCGCPAAEHHKEVVTAEICEGCPLRDATDIPVNQRMKNIAASLQASAKYGRLKATPEKKAARLAICEVCPSGKFIRSGKCKDCGCRMRIKAGLEHFNCRLGHWDDIPEI